MPDRALEPSRTWGQQPAAGLSGRQREQRCYRVDRQMAGGRAAFERPTQPRRPGRLKGRVTLAPDFDETPLDFTEYVA